MGERSHARPNNQFHILLWHFMIVWKLRSELWQQKNWLLHQDNALCHTFSSGIFLPTAIWLLFSTDATYMIWPPVTFLFPHLKIPQFWHISSDRGRIADSAEHPQKTRIIGCINEWCICAGVGLLRRSWPKVSFWLDSNTGSWDYGKHCVCECMHIAKIKQTFTCLGCCP
jgi:hypothetical protein